MKLRKIILPFFGLVLLLCSCRGESNNTEYKMLLEKIDAYETNLYGISSEIEAQIADDKPPYDVMLQAYKDKDELKQDMYMLESKLKSLNTIISEKSYSGASQIITPLQLKQNKSLQELMNTT